jgi:hypothetical protein
MEAQEAEGLLLSADSPMGADTGDDATRDASLLRVVDVRVVDDGKSTLLGRLLCECGASPTTSWRARSGRRGARDARRATSTTRCCSTGWWREREQSITIDVAYRYFARTAQRSSSPTRRATSSTRATW